MEFRAPRHDGLELPAEDCFLAEDNEEIEDRNAIRILRWILASHARGSGTNSLAPSALGLPPPTSLLVFAPRYLLILNEGNVRHMLRSPRYRRRILRFVRAGLLYSDSARLSDLLSRSLQRYMMTFDFVQHTRIANRQRNRNVVDTRSSFDPPRAGWESEPRRREGLLPRRGFDHPWLGASVRVPSTDAYGLTSQQVYYVRQHLVYPPPTNLTEIANVAVDFAEIERDAIPLRDG